MEFATYRVYCKFCNHYIKTILLKEELSQEDAVLVRGAVCAPCRKAMFRKVWRL